MATSSISNTQHGLALLRYLANPQAHDDPTKPRNLLIRGINTEDDPQLAARMFTQLWRSYPKHIQAYHVIQSFDTCLTDNYQRANKLGRDLALRLLKLNGNTHARQPVLVFTQRDGASHHLHNHIFICNCDIYSGHALRGQQTYGRMVQKLNDQVLTDHHIAQPACLQQIAQQRYRSSVKQSHAQYRLKQRGQYSFITDLQNRIDNALLHSANWQQYQQQLKANGVNVKIFTKRGRKRKHLSYAFVGKDNKQHKLRAGSLGVDYMDDNIQACLDLNQQKGATINETIRNASQAAAVNEQLAAINRSAAHSAAQSAERERLASERAAQQLASQYAAASQALAASAAAQQRYYSNHGKPARPSYHSQQQDDGLDL